MLDRITELFIFGFMPLVMGMLATPDFALAAQRTLKGEVTYRERIALPPDAVLVVQLADVSRADAPAAVVAEQKISPAGQVPIRFRLKFDRAAIRPNATYALQARISVGGSLWFVTDTRYEVDPLRTERATLVLTRASQPAGPAPRIFGTEWLAEDIGGRGVVDTARSTLRIERNGHASGLGACNRYFASAKVEGNRISFTGIGATMMACAPALMDQERKLFQALRKAASFRVERGKLHLVDARGRDLARFARDR